MNLKELKKPFSTSDVEWRLAQCGETNGKVWAVCLAYIQARAVMDRLDDVAGPENWSVNYSHLPNGVMCNLSIKVNDDWIIKSDGAEETDIEAFKGGISSALKRAGSAWGIGRYLYGLESGFAQIVEKGTKGALSGKTKEGKWFYWLPPQLPSWALPQNEPNKNITPIKQTKPAEDKPSQADIDELKLLAKKHHWQLETVVAYTAKTYGKAKPSDLPQDQFKMLCKAIASMTGTEAMEGKPGPLKPEQTEPQEMPLWEQDLIKT